MKNTYCEYETSFSLYERMMTIHLFLFNVILFLVLVFWHLFYKGEHIWHPLDPHPLPFYLKILEHDVMIIAKLGLKDFFECGRGLKCARSENHRSEV